MSLKTLVSIALVIMHTTGFAGGFNCAKARTGTEHMICSDSELSSLDDVLNRTYQQVSARMNPAKNLVNDQRKWIIEERNMCRDLKCLNKAYRARIAYLENYVSSKSNVCLFSESSLEGYWQGNGAGDFEEMKFEVSEGKYTFLSWRHHRPEIIGSWKLQNCELYIFETDDTMNMPFAYHVSNIINNVLYVQQLGNNEKAAYKRMK